MKRTIIFMFLAIVAITAMSQTKYNLLVNSTSVTLQTSTGAVYKSIPFSAFAGVSCETTGMVKVFSSSGDMAMSIKRSLLLHYNGSTVPTKDSTIAADIYTYYNIWKTKPTRIVSKEFTRANITPAQYSTGDVICNSVASPAVDSLVNVALTNGGGGWLSRVKIAFDTANTSGASFRIHFYHTKPAAIADNAPLALVYTQQTNRLGYVDITAGIEGAGGNCTFGHDLTTKIPYTCTSTKKNIYFVVEAKGSYTPKKAGKVLVEVTCTDIY